MKTETALKVRGRTAGRNDYLACLCPVASDHSSSRKAWFAGWVAGIQEGGHRIPREVRPLLRRLGIPVPARRDK